MLLPVGPMSRSGGILILPMTSKLTEDRTLLPLPWDWGLGERLMGSMGGTVQISGEGSTLICVAGMAGLLRTSHSLTNSGSWSQQARTHEHHHKGLSS